MTSVLFAVKNNLFHRRGLSLVRKLYKMGDPVVTISDGSLKGTTAKTYKGEDVYAFLGIPYARPPVGDLRFKAPLPAEPWTGIKDATKDGNMCIQKDMMTPIIQGSEDCLYLNVFTKNIADNSSLKPVLVFIHGGAFCMGSNNSKVFSPTFLLTEDIVFVTINYRLGMLGFLKLSDPQLGVPGNAALKDQRLALKWVQKNIKNFGGDPSNVTIFGESAGSASVCYQVLSTSSKGLFHKAIMQSGSVLNPWPHIRANSNEASKFIKGDCESEADILDALMAAPAQALVEAQQKFMDEMIDDKLRCFGPCIESPNETAFLTRTPIDIITSGDYNKVPMIIGYNSNEGLIALLDDMKLGFPKNPQIHFEKFIPQQMNLPADCEQRKEISKKLKTIYSDDRSADRFLILGDAFFVSGIIGFAENVVRTSPEPVYFQVLSLNSERNGFSKMFGNQEPGVAHADDLGYFFSMELPMLPPLPIRPGSIEEKAVLRYMRLWANFMKHGNPTPDEKEFGVTWKPVTKDTVFYVDVNEELTLRTSPDEERMKVWRDIYKSHENTKNFMH